jgi:hypothetical protein
MQSDFRDAMDDIKATAEYQDTVNLQQQKESNRVAEGREKMNLKREEMNMKRELKEKDLQIARENKNQYDVKPSKEDKKKKK